MIRVRSTYNIKQSLIDLQTYIYWLKKNNFNEAIIVDTNPSSFIAFYNLCLENQIKPVFGYEKNNEYVIFPTTNESLVNFYEVINGNENDFSNLIVYKLNSELSFKNALKIEKNFNHEIYNSLFKSEFAPKILTEKINVLTKEDYCIDDIIIQNTKYEITAQNHLKKFENDYQILVSKIQNKIESKNIKLTTVEKQRLNYELKIIKEKKFCSYFLIYAQIVEYLNQKQILYGFGRGSASSSYVCYILNITKINPIKYGLIFERFLSLDRSTLPDIDLDIDANYRDEVIELLLKKYQNSCFICTYVKLGTRNAQLIVNEKYKLPDLILKKLLDKTQIKTLLDTDSSLVSFVNEVNKLKNVIVGTNKHPAGIVISDVQLNKYMPIKDSTSLFEYKYLEQLGFVKFDILKLNTLSSVKKTVELIKENYLNIEKFDLNDPKIFNLLNDMQTKYVFQLDSTLVKSILKKFKVESFDDLAILISLNRPGTLHLVEKIVLNKKNKVNTNSTYGVILFQEQIMELLINKYQLNAKQANSIRIAISKKDQVQMEKIRAYIVKKGQDPKWFDEVKSASSYAFNKAHAYSYARLVMQILFYKTYYPLEFLLAFTQDSLSQNDIIYLKYRNIKIEKFNNELKSQNFQNKVNLNLNVLKIDPQIKTFIVENKVENFMEVRNRFENKINDNDIKSLVASKLFENKYQTCDGYEIKFNNLSSLLRVRQWSKELNKEKWMLKEADIARMQLEIFGFSFADAFKNNSQIYIEEVKKFPNMIRGTLICNYGRLEFICFESIDIQVNTTYKANLVVNFYNQDMSLIIKNLQISKNN